MAIDASIYSNLQTPDFAGSFQKGLQLRDLMDQRNQKQALNSAIQKSTVQNPDGTTSLNQGMLLKELTNSDPQKALEMRQQFKLQDQADQRAKLEKARNDLNFTAQLIGPVNSPESYASALSQAEQAGIDVSQYKNMPFDQFMQIKPTLLGQTLTYKDRLDQEWKQMGYDLQKEELGIKRRTAIAKSSTPNFGKAPSGYRFKQDGSLEPIPGSPQAEAKQNAQQKAKQDARLVVQDIGRALELLDKSPTAVGPLDLGLSSYIPGTPSAQMEDLLAGIKANIGFNKLQAMRQASPTGGALGSVSEKENEMLQATAGKLNTSMTEDMFKENLKRLYNQYMDIVHGPGKGPTRYALSFEGSPNKSSNHSLEDLMAEKRKREQSKMQAGNPGGGPNG